MSYFVCRYKTDEVDIQALHKLLLDTIPVDKQNSSLRLGGKYSCLVSHGIENVIPDIAIKKEYGDSWLAMLGTPLVKFKDKKSEQTFLDGFLTSPEQFLRYKIDGSFALFCYDFSKDRFLAATDFNSTTPIFYAVRPNGVIFSSHELVLARVTNAEIDPLGFAQAIHLGVTWGSRTRFKNIFKMLPCQILIIDDSKRIHAESYWRPEDETVFSGSFEELLAKWMSSLKDSVWRFYECADYKSTICDFTGGEDARLLLAQCHALGIPFKAQVTGLDDDIDVIVAKRAASSARFDLMIRQMQWANEEDLLANALRIILGGDAYQGFFSSFVEFATNRASPLDDSKIVKFCGDPGGEAFRGSYYLRGKAIFPSRRSSLDYKFFTKLKYLLDYHPGLLQYSDGDFLESIYGIVNENLKDVEGFPLGTQIDHLLRVFQTCFLGMYYKVPLYLPFATRDLTRSVYYIPPNYKRGGRLTRACTEILFPELAFVRTQKGVPTIRKTTLRLPLFIPEYIHLVKSVSRGTVSRLFKLIDSKKCTHSVNRDALTFNTFLKLVPYCDWFSSSKSMITGHLYNADVVNSILLQTRAGSHRYLHILGRVINMELAFRWVYQKGL